MSALHYVEGAASRASWADWVAVGSLVVVSVTLVVDLARQMSDPPPVTVRRAASLAVTSFGSLVASVPLVAILALLWHAGSALAPDALVGLWRHQPLPGLVACFVAFDLLGYVYHRLGHGTRVGWASHRVHHLGERFDMTLVLRQPWLPVHGLVVLPLLSLAGFPLAAAALCSTVSLAYQALQHTSRGWSLGPFDAVLVTGRAHRHHHVVDGATVNLGTVLSVWDRWFGTWRDGAVAQDARYGTGVPEPLDPLRIQWEGWAELVRLSRRRPAGPSRRRPPAARPSSPPGTPAAVRASRR